MERRDADPAACWSSEGGRVGGLSLDGDGQEVAGIQTQLPTRDPSPWSCRPVGPTGKSQMPQGLLTTSISCAMESPNLTMTTSDVLGTGRDQRL